MPTNKTYKDVTKEVKRHQKIEDMGPVFGTKGKDGKYDPKKTKKKKTYAEIRRDIRELAKLRAAKGLKFKTSLDKK